MKLYIALWATAVLADDKPLCGIDNLNEHLGTDLVFWQAYKFYECSLTQKLYNLAKNQKSDKTEQNANMEGTKGKAQRRKR